MRTKMVFMSVLIAFIFVLASCGMFPKIGSDEYNRNVGIIERAARISFLLASKKIEFKLETCKKVKEEIDNFVIPLLERPDIRINKIAEEFIFAKLEWLDKEYRVILKDAFDTFGEFYQSPTLDEALTPEMIGYLKAFFKGIKSGCEVIIEIEENEGEVPAKKSEGGFTHEVWWE